MIIDVHTHLNEYGDGPVTRDVDARRDALLQKMQLHGVDYALVLTSYAVNDHRPSTRDVARSLQDCDALGLVAGIRLAEYGVDDLQELKDYLQDGVVKGLKLYPGYEPFYPYDARCEMVYDLAAEFEVPVMIHTGDTYASNGKLRFSHPLNVDDVAVDHRDVKFVICHLGNPWIMDGMEVMYKNPNVYTDVSGLVAGRFKRRYKHDMLEHVREGITYAGDTSRILFGTDWPICDIGSYLQFMRDLDLSDAARADIMGRNALRLFNLDVPAAQRRTEAA